MKRFAISLPDYQAKAVERIRRFRNVPRSRVIQEAIDRYIVEEEEREAVARYVDGYRRIPETAGEADAYAQAAADILGREDWS
jgi:metal-responsive CopG/Arc/MetJ family transcriptional regulator